MSKISLEEHTKKMRYLRNVIGQTLRDYKIIKSGRTIYYNLDFSLMCPALFQFANQGSNDFLNPVKLWMNHVLGIAQSNPNIKLVVSAATLYEFYDQMNHALEFFKLHKPKLLNSYFNKKIEDESGLKSNEIKDHLHIFSEEGYEQNILEPVNKFVEFLDSNTLYGIGDFFNNLTPTELNKYNELTNKFLQQNMHKRLNAPTNNRDFDNSKFHFRMDAVNTAITIILADRGEDSPLFVSPTLLNLEQCTLSDKISLGRHDRVPLFSYNISRLEECNYFADPVTFLEDGFRVCSNISHEINKHDTYEDVPMYIKEKLDAFYKIYTRPLVSQARNQNYLNTQINKEITANLSSKNKMSSIIDNAIDDLESKASELDMYASRIDLSYLDGDGIQDDPIVKKLTKNLKLG